MAGSSAVILSRCRCKPEYPNRFPRTIAQRGLQDVDFTYWNRTRSGAEHLPGILCQVQAVSLPNIQPGSCQVQVGNVSFGSRRPRQNRRAAVAALWIRWCNERLSAAATSRPKLRNRAHLRSAAPCQVSRSSVKLAKLEPGTCQAQSLNLSASSLVETKPPSTKLVFNCDEQTLKK